MKSTLGVLAALLLAATVAVGQQLEFPQPANPAVQNGTYFHNSISVTGQQNLPSAMAIQSNLNAFPQRERRNVLEGGSPFPMAANPSPTTNSWIRPSFEGPGYFGGSPFPMAANPSLQ